MTCHCPGCLRYRGLTSAEMSGRAMVAPMTDIDTTVAALVAPVNTEETPAPPAPVKPKRVRKPKAAAAPEPPAPVSETAPLVDYYGGTLDGRTWRKLQRGPWPQAMHGETGEPVTPVQAVKLLAESPNGIYLHVGDRQDDQGNTLHMYVHSSIITAWRLMWGPA